MRVADFFRPRPSLPFSTEVPVPYPSFKQHLAAMESAFADAMGLMSAPRPTWLAEHISLLAALNQDEKELDLPQPKRDQEAIRQTEAYRAELARTSPLEVPHRVTSWGLIEMQPMETLYWHGLFREVVALKFRPRVLASEPALLDDLQFGGESWSLNRVFTDAVQQLAGSGRKPAKLFVNRGEGNLDAAVVFVVCPSCCTDWHAVGKALAARFGEQFDSAIVKLLDRTRNVYNAARQRAIGHAAPVNATRLHE
ncbi:hypothetical protein [Paraburkholderia dinghuensis]|uniref:Uncharacterized protein n=1 Tax=Paraburkholderia dinghuensis TaxID=2305225 RepID=A0A3N6MMD9_9BURK|nr:hypothetical protein [Paraburkholderia dinghuensis]RQH05004.1 hypothetical protein D1Y85_16475 [Paraburkholderia dinghuensis]